MRDLSALQTCTSDVKGVSRRVGYFVFSLDTELGWGNLWNQPSWERISRDAATERATIRRLLDMMDEFGVVATWAITGHLFYEACEECDVCPVMELKGRDHRFDQIWGTQDSMWYGADIVATLLSRNAGHEIGYHGYTHRTFDRLSQEDASFEIREWLRLAARRGIAPQTVIFPQGRIRYLELFRQAGFSCYRGPEVQHPLLRIPLFGKVLNKINLQLAILSPQVFEPAVGESGLVNLPGSLWLFRTNRGVELILDALNLHNLRLRPAVKGIARTAKEKKVIHLWVHPQEFRTEKDFAKLRFVFNRFAEQAKAGNLQSITMANLARQIVRNINP